MFANPHKSKFENCPRVWKAFYLRVTNHSDESIRQECLSSLLALFHSALARRIPMGSSEVTVRNRAFNNLFYEHCCVDQGSAEKAVGVRGSHGWSCEWWPGDEKVRARLRFSLRRILSPDRIFVVTINSHGFRANVSCLQKRKLNGKGYTNHLLMS